MGFRNEILGGVTLVRPAIQSPDYVPGVSGWSIAIDGSAEFNNASMRGDLAVGTPPNEIRITAGVGIELPAAGGFAPAPINIIRWHTNGGATTVGRIWATNDPISGQTGLITLEAGTPAARSRITADVGGVGLNTAGNVYLGADQGSVYASTGTGGRFVVNSVLTERFVVDSVGVSIPDNFGYQFASARHTGMAYSAPTQQLGLFVAAGAALLINAAGVAAFHDIGSSANMNLSGFATTPLHWAGGDIYGFTSSRKVKSDIVDLVAIADRPALEVLGEIQPRRWMPNRETDRLVADGKVPYEPRAGFVVEELDEISSLLVGAGATSPDLAAICALLVAGWQDHERRLGALDG